MPSNLHREARESSEMGTYIHNDPGAELTGFRFTSVKFFSASTIVNSLKNKDGVEVQSKYQDDSGEGIPSGAEIVARPEDGFFTAITITSASTPVELVLD